MGDTIRTYRVLGQVKDVPGETALYVQAFTAEDALVQLKLEHQEQFRPRSIEPVPSGEQSFRLELRRKGLDHGA